MRKIYRLFMLNLKMGQDQIENICKELMVDASLPSLARFSLMMFFSLVIAAVGLIRTLVRKY